MNVTMRIQNNLQKKPSITIFSRKFTANLPVDFVDRSLQKLYVIYLYDMQLPFYVYM